jgi:DNA-directed RNA polymerase specialized sigma24 family protein
MIEYIHRQLIDWADWVAHGRRVVGLSYPGQCAFTRMAAGGSWRSEPQIDEEASKMDRAVCALGVTHSDLADVVRRFYLRTTSAELLARELGIHRDTVYVRIGRGHQEILGYLNDIEAAVPLPEPRCTEVIDFAPTKAHTFAKV